MGANGPNQQADAFWNFLAYLRKYVEMSKNLLKSSQSDSGRTRLLSALAEYMRPILRADMSFVGYRDIGKEPAAWLNIVPDTIKPQTRLLRPPPLIKRLKVMEWCFLYEELEQNWNGTAIVFLDQQLAKFPVVFRGSVTALAISKVTLQEREYFLFFCDIDEYTGTGARYNEFDKVMLDVATGLLGAGFESGVRGGKRAERNEFLSDLIRDFGVSIESLLTDLDSLQSSLPDRWTNARQKALQCTTSARHLDLLYDTIQLSLSDTESELWDEPLVHTRIDELLQETIQMYAFEAQERGIEIQGPRQYDGRPFPIIPVYPTQLTIAFRNIVHNAIVHPPDERGTFSSLQISGLHLANQRYAIDFQSYGPQIVEDKDTQESTTTPDRQTTARPDPARRGQKLNIATVNRIVENHSGEIEIESNPALLGRFQTRVRIILPMEGPQRKAYDVFLLCDSVDTEQVKVLASRLRQAGMNPWFAIWDIIPGDPRQEAIEEALENYKTIAVFWGSKGITGWQNEEMRVAIQKCIDNKDCRIIPVALPGVEISDQIIPPTLIRRTWVKFQHLDDLEAFRVLVSGIRGEPPGPG